VIGAIVNSAKISGFFSRRGAEGAENELNGAAAQHRPTRF